MRDKPLVIIVCGGRDYESRSHVFDTLDEIQRERGIFMVIEGNARGADLLAREWAQSRQVACVTVPARWKLFGKRAGPIRNQEMLEHKPDLVVAFPGGRGTADMVTRAKAAGIPVSEVSPRCAEKKIRLGEPKPIEADSRPHKSGGVVLN